MARARDVVVRFLAETRDFLRGADDIADAYTDMARDAERAADAGEDAARDTARAWDRAADAMRRDVDGATRDIGGDVADTGREAGTEFAQNMGEAISSGDWSAVANDTAGGLSASLLAAGPIGAVAGAAVALGGIFLAQFQARAAQVKELASQTFDAYRDGLIEQAEKEQLLITMLGVDNIDEAYREIGRIARELGGTAADVQRELLTAGDAVTPLDDAVAGIISKRDDLARGKGIGLIDRDAVDTATDYVKVLDAAAEARRLAAESARVERDMTRQTSAAASTYTRGAYGVGGSVYQQQVPRYANGGRNGP